MNRDRFAVGYRPRNRWLIRKPDPARYRHLVRVAVAVVFCVATVAGAAWPRLEAARLGYQVEELRATRDRLLEEMRGSRLRIAELTHPTRVRRLAEERGLAPPTEEVVIGTVSVGEGPR